MDVIHALVWPYLARVSVLWPDLPAEPDEDDGPIPGLVDESN
ncbi:hypothetical protein [Streptosporangium sp. CA-115845]